LVITSSCNRIACDPKKAVAVHLKYSVSAIGGSSGENIFSFNARARPSDPKIIQHSEESPAGNNLYDVSLGGKLIESSRQLTAAMVAERVNLLQEALTKDKSRLEKINGSQSRSL